jgi:hypothetical protein
MTRTARLNQATMSPALTLAHRGIVYLPTLAGPRAGASKPLVGTFSLRGRDQRPARAGRPGCCGWYGMHAVAPG